MNNDKNKEEFSFSILWQNTFFIGYVVVVTLVSVKFSPWFYLLLLFTPQIFRFDEKDTEESWKFGTSKQDIGAANEIIRLHEDRIETKDLESTWQLLHLFSDNIWFWDMADDKYVEILAVTKNENKEWGYLTQVNESIKFILFEEDRYTVYMPFTLNKDKIGEMAEKWNLK